MQILYQENLIDLQKRKISFWKENSIKKKMKKERFLNEIKFKEFRWKKRLMKIKYQKQNSSIAEIKKKLWKNKEI